MAQLDQIHEDTLCQFVKSYDKTKNILSPSCMYACVHVHMHKHVIANVHSHTGTQRETLKRNLHTGLSSAIPLLKLCCQCYTRLVFKIQECHTDLQSFS